MLSNSPLHRDVCVTPHQHSRRLRGHTWARSERPALSHASARSLPPETERGTRCVRVSALAQSARVLLGVYLGSRFHTFVLSVTDSAVENVPQAEFWSVTWVPKCEKQRCMCLTENVRVLD